MKHFINLILTMSFMSGLSFFSFQFCNWYGCNSFVNMLRVDLVCNTCTDISYHLKNHQMSIYGSIFTFLSYQLSTLINKAGSQNDKYIYEEYIIKDSLKSNK